MEELLEEAAPQAEQKEKKSWKLPGGKRPGKRRWKAVAAVVIVAAIGAAVVFGQGGAKQMGPVYRPEQVTRRDLSVKVAGTATLEPADSYQVTTLISGEIQGAPFEEGDLVEQGTLLYTLDSGNAQSSVGMAQISVEQAQLSYQQAKEALNPTAPISGTLNEVYVRDGDAFPGNGPGQDCGQHGSVH